MMTTPPDERCINNKCASNRNCRWYVKERMPNERVFYGIATLGECERFEDRRLHWRDGPVEND